jgi:protein-tyrosine phosphatase
LLRSRDLTWDGLLNVRDLGGHRTEDGGETRYGAVVRADSLDELTEEGWQAVVDYGIRTVVDLRMDAEREGGPPAGAPIDLLHISLFDDDKSVFEEVEAAAKAAPDVPTATRDVYLLFLEHFKANVAAAIRAVANAPEGGVVVHCMGGKDRTGLVSALLLRLACVPLDAIGEDYAVTAANLEPSTSRWIPAIEDETERAKWEKLRDTPANAMVRVVQEIERRYGDVASYLRAAGLTDAQLDRLRERLVAP